MDKQSFARFQGYKMKSGLTKDYALSLKVVKGLQPGDFVTDLDYGIGRFAGLEKININGQLQESVRLIYKNDDNLYVSIHSLHKISKFVGQEGTEPGLRNLCSAHWHILKNKTKANLKHIANEFIKLYGMLKSPKAFPFLPDTYLHSTLEASFIYAVTPVPFTQTFHVHSVM